MGWARAGSATGRVRRWFSVPESPSFSVAWACVCVCVCAGLLELWPPGNVSRSVGRSVLGRVTNRLRETGAKMWYSLMQCDQVEELVNQPPTSTRLPDRQPRMRQLGERFARNAASRRHFVC